MSDHSFRTAAAEDLPAIVALLADDPLGALRESPEDLAPYRAAYARIAADPGQHLLVAERDGQVVGTLQLTLIPGLARQGSTRALIEAVRVGSAERGSGLGTALVTHAVEEARRLGADLVQLTSDASRTDAHRFYERLGFTASHLGFKLNLR
ncbi:GNAT family N-acetyltransferase [Streptacidiphilus sp. P02-A3a]|uniref:GNAT family N-acetyltransferase n=1 Tax=Streptacidiphilus sp. P02-A3a TaxID=2704468 RepID=UPI0015FE11FB|nr:GNAT family N-acetyltransferase [Streptacidiphilus sp. P02-A3a]QMU68010.1 GNAT family N-acetyltransferase [Streptacidiphilus sp. P02-A3a]